MLVKSRGIVLNQISYGDSSLIVKVYTEEQGLVSFIVKGAKGKRSKYSTSIFAKLSLVELVFDSQPSKNLQMIKDITGIYTFASVPFDISKSTMAIFLTEVLCKVIREHEPNEEKFKYLFESVVLLDNIQEGVGVFHIWFLLCLTEFLGCQPLANDDADNTLFNLEEGRFQSAKQLAAYTLDEQRSKVFARLIHANLSEIMSLLVYKEERLFYLDTMLLYYKLHLPDLHDMRSIPILRAVFSD